MIKLLLVDDEPQMCEMLALSLGTAGFTCDKALSGMAALEKLRRTDYDIVLLDLMMPVMDGWEVCQAIRRFSDIPVIILTARAEKTNIVKGLKLGADDYVMKPFDTAELIARMEAVLRRYKKEGMLKSGLRWDAAKYQLTFNGKVIPLTPKEFIMIGYFIRHPDRVHQREQLIELLWGTDSETEGRTVDSHVRNVRGKIRKAGFPIDEHLKTVRGIGYKWVD